MLRVFIDPAMASTGIFAIRTLESTTDVSDIYFFNPKTNLKASPSLPEKYRNVKIMVSRIEDCLTKIIREGDVNETDFYVEAPFIGVHGSGLELAGLSFMLIDRILKLNKTKLYGGGRLFMLSASLVGGKDRKAKRERKSRKPFAIEAWKALRETLIAPKVYGLETLAKTKDDVATAFLFWYYCFGPGLEPKLKAQPTFQEVPQVFFENIYCGDDDGS